MPKRGYKTITVREEAWKRLQEFAKKRYMTVPKAVEYLLFRRSKEKEASD